MKLRPAGEWPSQKRAIGEPLARKSSRSPDPPLADAKARPCARCGKRFVPTTKRRLLCARCFGLNYGYDE